MTLPVRLSLDWCGAQWPRAESTVAGNRGMDRLGSRRWDGARRDFCYILGVHGASWLEAAWPRG